MIHLIRWLVDHATTVLLAVLVVFFGGLLSYITLPRESQPDVTIPVVIVTTPYLGVSPEDIESLITVPVENELASLKDIKAMRSTSAEGISIVSLEFEPEVDIDEALQKVRDRVSRARSQLPDDVEDPSVNEVSFSDLPVVLITLAGGRSEEQLKQLAEKLEEDIRRTPGVLDAKVTGGVEREIRVAVLPERLAFYGLSFNDVVGAIRDENVNVPGGNVTAGRGDFLLRVPGEFVEPEQLEQVAIKRVGDRPVFVRDVARVVDGTKDRETYARMRGQASVTLAITKRVGANILEVAENAKALAAQHAATWPEGVEYRVLADQSRFIRSTVDELQNNIITALILVVAVLIFSMGVRNSLFVALSIPLSMLMSFLVLDVLGYTLNMVVLFSLIMALGMLVDNGIVIVENIYRHAEMGKTRYQASIDGTAEVALAVIASTATTVAAFGPLVFWTGIMGQFMGYLPKTIIIVLVASLVVALGVLPVVTAFFMPKEVPRRAGADESSFLAIHSELSLVSRVYRRVLEWSIDLRYFSVVAGVVALGFTFVIYGMFNHGTEFFPDTEPDRAVVGIEAPQGTDVETTDRLIRSVEAILAQERNIDTFVAQTGVSAGGDALSGTSARPNEGRVTIDFRVHPNNAGPGDLIRLEDTRTTVSRLREKLQEIPGARITVEPEGMGPPVGAPIQVEIAGEDFHQAGEYAEEVKRRLAQVPGVTSLESDYKVGRPELRLRVDRGAARRVGVSTNAVGNAVRSAVAGAKASALRDGEDEYDIVVRLAPEHRDNVQDIMALRLPGREDTSPDTFPVPVSAVARYEMAGGSGSIQHVDQDLVVTLSGDVAYGFNENEVRAAVEEVIADLEPPPGLAFRIGGADQEQQDAANFLGRAFLLAVALILMVLVTQFDSLAMPMIILFSVVLSLIGVLWGLLLTGTSFGIIMTGIGVISLAGVVVNNAIVLLDYVQQLQARGLSVRDSLIEAGLTRLRPVLLTAITTVLGLVPMAVGVSVDFINWKLAIGGSSAAWWGPMAVAIIFGLAVATVLTLVMVPTLYSIYDDMLRLRRRFLGGAPVTAGAAVAMLLLLVGLVGLSTPARALTLEEAWAAGEAQDPQLALARAQQNQTRTLLGQAWSTVGPRADARVTRVWNQFEAEADFGEGFADAFSAIGEGLESGFAEAGFPVPDGAFDFEVPPSEGTTFAPQNFWQVEFGVSQRIFSGTALPLIRGARATVAAGELQVERQRQTTRLTVAQRYYQLLVAQQGLALAETALGTAEHQLDLAQRQVVAGLADTRATVQGQLQVARARRDLESAREQVVSAEEGLRLVTGLQGELRPVLPPAPEVPAQVDSALDRAQTGRSDLRAAELLIDARRYQRQGRTLAWMPTVDGRFAYIFDQTQVFYPEPWFWRLSISANWEFWDGGLRIAQRKEATAQLQASELQADLQRATVAQEVRTTFEGVRRAGAALAAMDEELSLAKENLRLAELGFGAGTVTWLEVEQARLALQNIELAGVRERMEHDLAALRLKLALGEL